MIINQANLAALFTGFKASFQGAFAAATPTWDKVALKVPSATKTEHYAWLGQFPRLREWIGDRQIKDLQAHDYTIKNKDYEATIGVLRTEIEDDTFGVYAPMFQEMGFAAATHPDELVFALLAAGISTKCYDGQFFFDTDHPVGNAQDGVASVSNWGGGAGTPWFLMDASRPMKPLIYQQRKPYNLVPMVKEDDERVFMAKEYRYGVDGRGNVGYGLWQLAYGSAQTLDKTGFNTARAAMSTLKSDEGRPLNVRPTLLVVGPSLEGAAQDLIKAERNAAGATNTLFNAVDILVSPYLT